LQKFYEGENMKKQIMSIAAAAALFTTGAIAFDSNTAGVIATDAGTGIIPSSYTAGDAGIATTAITKSSTQKGDALIYPYFTTEGNYSTEIVVRNTSEDAVVAKVVFYSGKDSKELRDFNIYLSGYDVFRFTIDKKGNASEITSEDGSVITHGVLERDVLDPTKTADDYTGLRFASKDNKFTAPLGENRGYVAIFGMVQSDDYQGRENPDGSKLAFHNRHDDLYAGYAKLLDNNRGSDWRYWRNQDGLLNPDFMVGSMFTGDVNIEAPNTIVGTEITWKEGDSNRTATFHGVDSVLTGQVNVRNTTNGTDMILPATAINNFSDGDKVVLWSPGEYASIADRCIEYVAGKAQYDALCVRTDANAFNVNSATYTYANKGDLTSADNKIFITQPYKRTLLQLGDTAGYTYNSTYTSSKVEAGYKSFFQSDAYVYNENEKTPPKVVTTTENTIVGAALSGNGLGSTPPEAEPTGYTDEVQMLNASAFELNEDVKAEYGKGNGFAKFNVGVPAIITQMVASRAGDSVETNWVYSDTE